LTDAELFERAQTEGRAIVTYDSAGFVAIVLQAHGEGRAHHGVVLVNQRRFPQRSRSIGILVRSIEALVLSEPSRGSLVTWLR
jgi:hypothetical protein